MTIFLETKRLILEKPVLADIKNLKINGQENISSISSLKNLQVFGKVMVFPGNEGPYRFWRSTIKILPLTIL